VVHTHWYNITQSRIQTNEKFCAKGADVGVAMPIAESVLLGNDVRVFHESLVNLYGCTIGDGSKIGAFVEIQKNARVGARCKISSHSFICEGVEIADEVFIGHGVMFTNDVFPRAVNADGTPQTRPTGRSFRQSFAAVLRLARTPRLLPG